MTAAEYNVASAIPAGDAKSPLPSAATLDAAITGSSWAVEMPKEVCTCGRPLGGLYARLSTAFDEAPAALSFRVFKEFATTNGLAMCCRSAFLSPLVRNVVDASTGVFYVSPAAPSAAALTAAASAGPRPATIFNETMTPPPLR